jgi:transitional endoplasmic reticulum ATPase
VRLELPKPTAADRHAIFQVHSANKPLSDDIDFAKLADETEGFVGSDIEAVCRRASMNAISDFLEGGDADRDATGLVVTEQHYRTSIESVRKLHETKPETPADEILPA